MSSDLIERLESATEGGRGFDSWIAEKLGHAVSRGEMHIDGHWVEIPDYTTSLDAALTLVPEGMDYYVGIHRRQAMAKVFAGNPHPVFPISAATPALALCVASLKAREME